MKSYFRSKWSTWLGVVNVVGQPAFSILLFHNELCQNNNYTMTFQRYSRKLYKLLRRVIFVGVACGGEKVVFGLKKFGVLLSPSDRDLTLK